MWAAATHIRILLQDADASPSVDPTTQTMAWVYLLYLLVPVVLLVGWWLIGLVRWIVRRLFRSSKARAPAKQAKS